MNGLPGLVWQLVDTAMTLLIIALGIFVATHLIPAFPVLKSAVVAKVGRPVYVAVFSIFSVLSLGLIIYAKTMAPFIEVYQPPAWARPFALSLMVPASILGIASLMPGFIRKFFRVPIFYAVLLWVAAHLTANGDLASVILFASLGAYACLSQILRKISKNHTNKLEEKAQFSADFLSLAIGVIVYAALLFLHPLVIGVAIWN